jgi:transcriptional regulator with XRE-family HTH domain
MIRLRNLREERGLTQHQLGQLFGLTKTAISYYENGQRDMSNEMLHALADYFDVSVDYLLGRSDQRETPPG